MSNDKGEAGRVSPGHHGPGRSKHRLSPPRRQVSAGSGQDPELIRNQRTMELATDQSITARHLFYYPNKACIEVIQRCVDGIGCIMDRLSHTGDKEQDLSKDEVLISMYTRLMANGGIGRLPNFNETLEELVKMKAQVPQPETYVKKIEFLADQCRKNMTNIRKRAVRADPDGAVARQAVMAFMGDLGGLEKGETGYGKAYKGPLCEPQQVYNAYIEGLCDVYRKLNKLPTPAMGEDLELFRLKFEEARRNTSIKGGGLSAPKHTKDKKGERVAVDWTVQERDGLLNTGTMAEERIKKKYPGHTTTLLKASWPRYKVSASVIQDVVEPLTGHISGTFGEMATTMNMFCGTPLETMTLNNPSGTPREEMELLRLVEFISALAAAGLITAGYHSAVELYQAMCTFSTQPTYGAIGPKAVEIITNHVRALREYASRLSTTYKDKRPKTLELYGHRLAEDELYSDAEDLEAKAISLEEAATKSVDMISILQGEGGTIATLEVNRVMANASSHPKELFDLYSVNTKLEELGVKGYTLELEEARRLKMLPPSPENDELLADAIRKAQTASERRAVSYKKVREAEERFKAKNDVVFAAEMVFKQKREALSFVGKDSNEKLETVWGMFKLRKNPSDELVSAAKRSQKSKVEALSELKSAQRDLSRALGQLVIARDELETAKMELRGVEVIVMDAAVAKTEAARAELVAIEKGIWSDRAEEIAADKKANYLSEQERLKDLTIKMEQLSKKGGRGASDDPKLAQESPLELCKHERSQALDAVKKAKDEAESASFSAKVARREAKEAMEEFTHVKIKAKALCTEVIAMEKEAWAAGANEFAHEKENTYQFQTQQLARLKQTIDELLKKGWGPGPRSDEQAHARAFPQVQSELDVCAAERSRLVNTIEEAKKQAILARAEADIARKEAHDAKKEADEAKKAADELGAGHQSGSPTTH